MSIHNAFIVYDNGNIRYAGFGERYSLEEVKKYLMSCYPRAVENHDDSYILILNPPYNFDRDSMLKIHSGTIQQNRTLKDGISTEDIYLLYDKQFLYFD